MSAPRSRRTRELRQINAAAAVQPQIAALQACPHCRDMFDQIATLTGALLRWHDLDHPDDEDTR